VRIPAAPVDATILRQSGAHRLQGAAIDVRVVDLGA
jgi:hypothetical protein